MRWNRNRLSVVAFLAACASPAAVVGDDHPADPPPLMITHNPDGTFTIRKEASKKDAKDGKAPKGLVIPAQVVVPMIPAGPKSTRP
jgi:hypothetical protein